MLEPYRDYLVARFADDPHVLGTVLVPRGGGARVRSVLLDVDAGAAACWGCVRGVSAAGAAGVGVTTEIDHPPGEELQFDWLELRETPWGQPAYVLVGALSHSGRCRGVFCEGQTFPHLIECPGRRAAAAGRHHAGVGGPTGWPASSTRARTGCCRSSRRRQALRCRRRRLSRRGGRSAKASSSPRSITSHAPGGAQPRSRHRRRRRPSLDRCCVDVADERRRGAGTIAKLAGSERLLGLPRGAVPGGDLRASGRCRARRWSRSRATATASPPRWRAPDRSPSVPASASRRSDRLRRGHPGRQAPPCARGRRAAIRCAEHAAGLEQAVLAAFTTRTPCRRKQNRPPGQAALQAAAVLRGEHPAKTVVVVVIDLERYAQIAEVAR